MEILIKSGIGQKDKSTKGGLEIDLFSVLGKVVNSAAGSRLLPNN